MRPDPTVPARVRPGPAAALGVLALCACNRDVQGATTFDPTMVSSSDDGGATLGTTTHASAESSSPGPGADTSSGAPDESSESSLPELCGDGLIVGSEECDCENATCTLEGLGGMSCTDIQDPGPQIYFTGGDLGCDGASCRFDTSGCLSCGDGMVVGDLEACEPDVEITTTCAELGRGTAGTLACNDDCTLDTSGCTDCGYQFDFDGADCESGFTSAAVQGGANSWECGDPTNYNLGPGVAKTGVFATNLDGPYAANETSAITSPVLDLTACAGRTLSLSMHHFHNFEGGVINADGAIVQVSADGGPWTTLVPISGSAYSANALNATGTLIDGAPGFSGNVDDNMWVDSTFDLTEHAGDDAVQVRFVFGSDANNHQGGWYIDAVELLGGG